MVLARHGVGARAHASALLSQVHPVFMLPPIAASAFGGLLAVRYASSFSDSAMAASLHVVAIFLAVYTAHVKDGYVDFHVRDEDDDHPVTAPGCRLLLGGASAGFFLALAGLWWIESVGAVLLTLPTWLIAYHHAPQLDTNPLGATLGYPSGIAISLLGGFYVQAGTLLPIAVAFAVVFLVLLAGVKVIDDAQDYDYDRSIAKRTVAVVVGPQRARTLAFGLMATAVVGVVGLVIAGVVPRGSIFAAAAFAMVASFAHRGGPELATMLLVRGSYLFLAGLVGAVWFQPLG